MKNVVSREVRSLTTSSGELRLSLEDVSIPALAPDEVLIRVEAAPINPSDLGLLFARTDPSTLTFGGTSSSPFVTGGIPPELMTGLAARLDQSMTVGNEGAGTVVDTGSEVQEWRGRTVAALTSGSMYAQYRVAKAALCIALPPGTQAKDGASLFSNPFSVLAMLETMRREGHTALIHTAAASNLGQMLIRVCQADGVQLINIVRKEQHVALLRELGAQYVLDSTSATFADDLSDAIVETGATLAFDAIGGGHLAGTILASMEVALSRRAATYSRYGSDRHKQVYIYGALDPSPTELNRRFGLAWGLGGWLVTPRLQTFGADTMLQFLDRILKELTTTFASHYTGTLTLEELLTPEAIASYSRSATGQKYLVVPNGVQDHGAQA